MPREVFSFHGTVESASMRILLVEDSKQLQMSITRALRNSGFKVDSALDGETAVRMAHQTEYDVIILDLLLPRVDGLTVLQTLCDEENPARVLILSAKDEVQDKVIGLQRGADDYLTKPFQLAELLARVEALIRRRYGLNAPTLTIGDLVIRLSSRQVTRDHQPLALTAREYSLLLYLALRKGEVVTRGEIAERLYEEDGGPESNAIDSAICKLRAKVCPEGTAALIHTRRGLGYCLQEG